MSGQPNPLRRKEWQDEARREQQADERIRELEEECDALGGTLYDLKTHVENVRLDDAFRYPDTVRELLDRAETLCDGDMPDLVERNRELGAENERLRTALRTVRRHVYGSRSAFQVEDTDRELGHFGAPRAVKITDTDGEHPSACSYRVEAIEVVAEEIESALDGGGESTDA